MDIELTAEGSDYWLRHAWAKLRGNGISIRQRTEHALDRSKASRDR
jgi:hypothetical protein